MAAYASGSFSRRIGSASSARTVSSACRSASSSRAATAGHLFAATVFRRERGVFRRPVQPSLQRAKIYIMHPSFPPLQIQPMRYTVSIHRYFGDFFAETGI